MQTKERPILFSAPMVRAILDGRKTQTRRTKGLEFFNASMPDMWDKVEMGLCGGSHGAWFRFDDCGINRDTFVKFPYGQPGDRLWVRETWMPDPSCDDDAWDNSAISYQQWDGCGMPMRDYPDALKTASNVIHRASWDGQEMVGWKPSIHMPRWASRIQLEIVSVRVQRLNEISEADAKAEGAPDYEEGVDAPPPDDGDYSWSYCASFRNLWESINGAGSWRTNPWVWVIEFRKI